MNKIICEEVAKLLYELFVVNNKVIALQMPDGNYIPQTVSYNSKLFEQMLIKRSSLAVYQQRMYTNNIRWICFDFDCTKGEDGTVEELIQKYIINFCKRLDEQGINYLTEFSGRRGIHVWIIFDSIFTKSEGYFLAQKLLQNINPQLNIDKKYNIDLFPAVPIGRNKLGKAVKLPISVHRKGGQSYFVKELNDFDVNYDPNTDGNFLSNQLEVLANFKKNKSEGIIKKEFLSISQKFYEKQRAVIGGKKFSLSEIVQLTNKSSALLQIWDRVLDGRMIYSDRLVLAGVFGNFGDEMLLRNIFEIQEDYDPIITETMLSSVRKQLYPIKMWYLYDLYKLDLEFYIDKNQTVLEYICECLGVSVEEIKIEEEPLKAKVIASKEIRYLDYNDEVFNPKIYYDLKNMYQYDFINIDNQVADIINGDANKHIIVGEYYSYFRFEENKIMPRRLISLSARDRVLTTLLTYELAEKIQWRFDSYSYNLNFWNDKDIFFPWFNSWSKFINDIEIFLRFDIFSDYSFMKIDISSFYDSIYVHAVYKQMLAVAKRMSPDHFEEISNIIDYLARYNDNIMKKENVNIKGIPQGPVYGRVLAEFFVSTILKEFSSSSELNRHDYQIFRYVDDLYIVYKDISGTVLLEQIIVKLQKHGLSINNEKTKDYGLIGSMSKKEKEEIFNGAHWNYDLVNIKDMELMLPNERKKKIEFFENYLSRNDQWNVGDANFILGMHLDQLLINKYINKYFEKLISSREGRGSIFKKLYSMVFADLKMMRKFINKNLYTTIPPNSVNMFNFLSELYFKKDMLMDLVSEEEFLEMINFLSSYSENEISEIGREIVDYLKEELNSNGY